MKDMLSIITMIVLPLMRGRKQKQAFLTVLSNNRLMWRLVSWTVPLLRTVRVSRWAPHPNMDELVIRVTDGVGRQKGTPA